MHTITTSADTAFTLVTAIRALYTGNRERMDTLRRTGLGDELAGILASTAASASSAIEMLSAIVQRFGWQVTHDGGSPLCAWLPREVCDLLGLSGGIEHDSGAIGIEWMRLAALLDLQLVRQVCRSSAPFLAAAVVAFEVDRSLFAGITSEPGGAFPASPKTRTWINTNRYYATLTALEPLAHGDFDRAKGNVTAMRREDRYDLRTGLPSSVPFLSGASVRGQLRRAAVHGMLSTLDIDAKDVEPNLMNSLLSGGGMDAGAKGAGINVALRRKLRSLCPLVDLFGGVFENELIEGALLGPTSLLPICRETAALLPFVAEDEIDSLPSVESITVTRHATRHPSADLDVARDDRMIFATEAIAAGTRMFTTLALRGDGVSLSPVTRSAAAWAVEVFQESGQVGAKGSAGFGAVEWTPFVLGGQERLGELPDVEEGASELFLRHLADNAEELREWLQTGKLAESEAENARAEKPKRAKKGKAS